MPMSSLYTSHRLAGGPQAAGRRNRQQINCSKTAQQRSLQRSLALPVRCIYTGNDGQHRRELERRSALALSCTERQTTTADLLGGFGQSAIGLSAPKRLRIAVDVDEGKLPGRRGRWKALVNNHELARTAWLCIEAAHGMCNVLQFLDASCLPSTSSAKKSTAWSMMCQTTGCMSLPRYAEAGVCCICQPAPCFYASRLV